MIGRGTLSAVYSVHCGGCGRHFTPHGHLSAKASDCAREAKRLKWAQTRAFGWLCPACDKDLPLTGGALVDGREVTK